MNSDKIYEFENVNSRLVMDILDGKMEENTNVQQSVSKQLSSQRWVLKPSSEGKYYYIHSYNDENYVLKATSNINGGNICIVPYTNTDTACLFKFSKNPDGSFMIMTKASKDICFVEVINAKTDEGANIQQWEATNHFCQNWKLNEVDGKEDKTFLSVVKTEIYKTNDCLHTIVYVK